MSASTTRFVPQRTSNPFPHDFIGVTESVRVSLISDPPGRVEFSGSPNVAVSIHVGPSVEVDCERGGERHRGTAVHGDVGISPPNLAGVWELKSRETALVIGINPRVLERVVEESGGDPRQLRIKNHFQVRDPQIEHIGWALKEEMESGYPHGRIYVDSLAMALATILVRNYSSLSVPPRRAKAGMPARRLRAVLAYIEDNLDRDLGLRDIAHVASLSVSHFKVVFRESMGLPAHQYVIRRRVERAALLLRRGEMPISQVALETGFCHQSHLALHMHRVLGATPQEVRDRAS
jgi:AraC family transcriptional regulator